MKLSPEEKESMMQEATRESVDNRGYILPVHLNLLVVHALVGNVTLALRHPANKGEASEMATFIVEQIADRLEKDGLPANAKLVRFSLDPENDDG